MKKLFAGGIIILSIIMASNFSAAFWEEVKKDTKEAARSVKETSKDLGKNIKEEATKGSKDLGKNIKKEAKKFGQEVKKRTGRLCLG